MASIVTFAVARPVAGYLAVLTLSFVCGITQAQPPQISFDLPAQPLKQALEQYDAHTSLSVFFPSELATGRVSTAVQGDFTPEQALHKLLEGTGLAVQSAAEDAFVLVATPSAISVLHQQSLSNSYDALVQESVRRALCAQRNLALGTYRIAMLLQLNELGHVEQARLLDTTGDRRRDSSILKAVKQVDIGQPPLVPGKPFVILVKPLADNSDIACAVSH